MQLQYVDAALPETKEKFGQFTKAVDERRASYPLVVVNGELKASGGVDTYQLMFLIDQDRKEKGLPARR